MLNGECRARRGPVQHSTLSIQHSTFLYPLISRYTRNGEWGMPRSARPGSTFDIQHSTFNISLSLDLRIRVPHVGQIRRARARIELAEQGVVRRLALELRHARGRVVLVAEDDGVRRAGLRAG